MNMPQIASIGIYNSQKASTNTKASKNRKTTMFELEFPMEKGGVSYINGQSMPIDTNVLICAKPGQTRHTRFPFKCYYVHMIIEDGILYDTLINTPDFFETKKSDVYKSIFMELCKYYDTGVDDNEIIIQSLILKLIHVINNDSKRIANTFSVRHAGYAVIEDTLKYIKEHPTDCLSLEALASRVHLSPIHFHNLFKTSVGKTLHDYVEEQRIKKAVNLLITTDYSLTKIAYECGFSSQSYFSYVFKRRMNKTPREYVQEVYSKYEI